MREAALVLDGEGMQLADFLSHDVDPSDPAGRDPEFIRTVALPVFDALRTHYFRSELEGAENVPRQGPFIAVANHNGGPLLPDCWVLVSYWWSALGPERPAYAMVHDAALRVPLLRTFLVKVGGLRASPENAEKVLGLGAPLLIAASLRHRIGGDGEGQPRSIRSRTAIAKATHGRR